MEISESSLFNSNPFVIRGYNTGPVRSGFFYVVVIISNQTGKCSG